MKLETKRLILREPKMSDWKDLVGGVGNFNIAKNTLGIPHPYKEKDAKEYLKKATKKFGKEEYMFYIELKSEKKVIGAIGLHKIDEFSGIAETGSWINRNYQKRGYITEAKIAANEFAFNKLKLRRLYSPVFADNKASNATQKRMGYKLEGRIRKAVKCKSTGKIHDENFYSLLKEDWKKVCPKLIKYLNEKIKKLEN